MPVVVNQKKCDCAPNCFAASACPKDALYVDRTRDNLVTVEPELCGDCPAPCLNFCDRAALKYAPNLLELDIVRREVLGEITLEQATEERKLVAAKLKEEAEAKAQAEADAATKPVKLTTDNFVAEVVESDLPVLVDFWAEWCGPCKQIAPVIEELAKTFAGKVKFGKLNVDEEPAIPGQLQIQSIPTLIIFFQGQIADMIVGAVPKAQLQSRLQRVVEAVAQLKARQAGGEVAADPQASSPTAPAQIQPRRAAPRPTLAPPYGNPPQQPPRRPRGR